MSCSLLAQHIYDPEDGSSTVRLSVGDPLLHYTASRLMPYCVDDNASTDLGETVSTLLFEGRAFRILCCETVVRGKIHIRGQRKGSEGHFFLVQTERYNNGPGKECDSVTK